MHALYFFFFFRENIQYKKKYVSNKADKNRFTPEEKMVTPAWYMNATMLVALVLTLVL